MRCLECSGPVSAPGLLVAMEQREHFAMVRHAELCTVCAMAILPVFKHAAEKSRFWHQSVNCAMCNSKFPIARLRFEIRDRAHLHIAVCQPCYETLRDDLVRFSNFVGFIEKEWQSTKSKSGHRMPWPAASMVRVRQSSGHKLSGQVGCIESFRCLVQPWFGYTVRFSGGLRHFFHERDLEQVDLEKLVHERPEALHGSLSANSASSGGGDSPGHEQAQPEDAGPQHLRHGTSGQ